MTEPEEALLQAGDVLAGKYRLVTRLGAGGMGEVWEAEHTALGSMVAVKILRRRGAPDEAGVGRFEREARAVAALSSEHIVRMLDYGRERGVPFLVMERLHGETLAERLGRDGPLDAATAVRVVGQVAEALEAAHASGIVHRDVKPENVFLAGEPAAPTVKLLDFGVAKVTAEIAARAAPARTRTGALLGTPLYMSPEQLRGRPVDRRADLWSLALVAFECVTARSAFAGETVAEICAEILSGPIPVPSRWARVPRGFDAWFRRAASRDREGRFGSAREMAHALAALLEQPAAASPEDAKETAHPSMTVSPATRTVETLANGAGAPRPRPWVALGTAGVAAALGIAAVVSTRPPRADTGPPDATAAGAAVRSDGLQAAGTLAPPAASSAGAHPIPPGSSGLMASASAAPLPADSASASPPASSARSAGSAAARVGRAGASPARAPAAAGSRAAAPSAEAAPPAVPTNELAF